MPHSSDRELRVAAASLAAFAILAAFAWLGVLLPFDEPLLSAMRAAADPRRLPGSEWGAPAARFLTRLGGWNVLLVAVAATALWLALVHDRQALALLLVFTAASGMALDPVLKDVFRRERPTLVPLLAPRLTSASFPSGHALGSSVVYFSVALALGRVVSRRAAAALLVSAALLCGVVGLTRVALGVHYPSDVLGGWAVGVAWAILWSRLAARLEETPPPADAGA